MSGKTTALECVEGLHTCDGGKVRVLGGDLHAQRAEATQVAVFDDLATNSMDEAERLCDRVALISNGRLATVDTPSGLIEQIQGETRLTAK
ncbi:hypothetical protein AB0D04_13690 [Streptomyces sp. NPDC048483]|uniref:hypothetical protein n=1 Tax=Streptomyces sp. NPDC048483 TaxID=3154927 RepID=UPI003427706D